MANNKCYHCSGTGRVGFFIFAHNCPKCGGDGIAAECKDCRGNGFNYGFIGRWEYGPLDEHMGSDGPSGDIYTRSTDYSNKITCKTCNGRGHS